MLFGAFLPDFNPNPERRALLDAILLDVSTAFPDLHFELRLDRKVINAQAISLGGKRCVLIYGGLGLHPALAEDSLTFAFLHEAGHHLADGPRLPFNSLLSCDCAADHWAAGDGARMLCRNTGRRFHIEKALDEFDHLMGARDAAATAQSAGCSSECWSKSWAQRRNALETARPRSSDHVCEL